MAAGLSILKPVYSYHSLIFLLRGIVMIFPLINSGIDIIIKSQLKHLCFFKLEQFSHVPAKGRTPGMDIIIISLYGLAVNTRIYPSVLPPFFRIHWLKKRKTLFQQTLG